MRINRNAASVVAHHDTEISQQFDLDPAGMAGDRLVHRIVEDLGHKVMQGAFIGAADIHAGALADRFQSLQHLDRGCGIAFHAGIGGREKVVGHGLLVFMAVLTTISCPGRVGQVVVALETSAATTCAGDSVSFRLGQPCLPRCLEHPLSISTIPSLSGDWAWGVQSLI